MWLGFEQAQGEILMILDADLTVRPEDLPRFVQAMADGRGEFVNGCRLVYPRSAAAMPPHNTAANRFFAAVFSWLLRQRLKKERSQLFRRFRSLRRLRSFIRRQQAQPQDR